MNWKLIIAALCLGLMSGSADARKAHRVNLAPVPVAGAMVDDRYPNLRLPEAYGTARQAQPRRHSSRRHSRAPVVAQKRSLVRGFAAEVRKALPQPKLAGVVPVLAAKVAEICQACGSRPISTVRHTYVAGTHRISLHASGKAVDVAGNPTCIYAHLKSWPGGYSIDYARLRHPHVHISYDPGGRREWGARFVHGHTRILSARGHHHRYRRRR